MVPAADQIEHLGAVDKAQFFKCFDGPGIGLATGKDQVSGPRQVRRFLEELSIVAFDAPELAHQLLGEGLCAPIAEESGEHLEVLRFRRKGVDLPVVLHL